ncbi:MAG: COX15/CtaA family protein [Planctomycetes bacterium]|nr:COX15/CtaA family protein [Planctomycetota bacterium]
MSTFAADAPPGAAVPGRVMYWLALATAAAMFPLIVVGAGVTSKDAGMAYRDGFYSDGHFWNPPFWFEHEATRWEHGHRLLGRAVGMLAIALAVVAWRRRGLARRMAIVTLLAIVAQGLLGYFRVAQISRPLAMVHGVGAQACFCVAAATALVASRAWAADCRRLVSRAGGLLQRLCLAGVAAIFLQVASGAALRHFPSNAALIAHVLLAVLVTLLVGWIVLSVVGQHSLQCLPGKLGMLLGVLMVAQLLLGGASFLIVVMGVPAGDALLWAVPSAHVAAGALILACSVLLAACAYHMIRPADARQDALTAGAAVPA